MATDFSPCSEAALRCATGLARSQQGSIVLLHVVSFEPSYTVATEPLSAEIVEDANGAGHRMDQALASPEIANVPHRALFYRGDLSSVLEEVVPGQQVDLIVLGTHGREGVTKLFVGSVAEQVLRHSTCPVMTVGPHVDLDYVDDGRYPRVLFATDFSPSSLHALQFATVLARQNLTLLHVLFSGMSTAEYEASTFSEDEYRAARNALRGLVSAELDPDIVVREGLPAQVIVDVAREHNASLIVMGVNPRSAFAATHFPWATAHRVICDAHCPVLTVK